MSLDLAANPSVNSRQVEDPLGGHHRTGLAIDRLAEIERLSVAVGCRVIEGDGSRVRFERNGVVAVFH